MALYRDLSGELAITARWTKCAICKMPTSQPPVCCSPICEARYERRAALTDTPENGETP